MSNAIVSELCKSNPNYFHKISLIENGVDEVFLNITRTPKQSKSETLRFITIGSLIPRKGVDTILHALKNCSATKQVYLTIVGDGPEKDNLLVLSRSFENINQISFTGGVKPSEIPQLLANHDVFLLASYSEGRPNVILEAMAANMPVIATNIEGVNELVIPNKTGLLFEAGSRKQLSENIDYLINNPSMQRKMGEAARSAIIEQGLTWERTAIHYKQIYNNLIFEKI
ncbi:glycosyltransferase family 4 protein [Methylobacter marinus]|uniref:glycosyltransferase family 4 protein n=1 Tax=Methylobacter marinus TaxID=34058 RepID=UPI0018DB68EF|nr:glycosyltransferase family 4 protein [Methylobacter marinus]